MCRFQVLTAEKPRECMYLCIHTHTHIHVHIYISIYICGYIDTYLSTYHQSICLSIYPSVCLPTHSPIHLSIYLPIVYLASIYPSHEFTQILLILILNHRAYSSILLSILLTPFLKNEKSDSLIIHMFILGGQSSVLNQFFLSAASACSPYPQ